VSIERWKTIENFKEKKLKKCLGMNKNKYIYYFKIIYIYIYIYPYNFHILGMFVSTVKGSS
jgi:hypothetical protein